MRFACLLLLLFVGPLAASQMACADLPSESQAALPPSLAMPSSAPAWVRTTGGWEQPTAWRAKRTFTPALHPAVVAGFVALAGVAVLLGCPPRGSLAKKPVWRQKTLF